jgi:hypothetical protein
MNINSYIDQSSSEKFKTTNLRAYLRNVPSQPLQPYLNARPVLTKYSILPVVDPRQQINVPLTQCATYDMNTIFNPGNASAPWSGYSSNVNKESELRNQIYALQSCPQAYFVPSSDSSLYKWQWSQNNSINQPFPDLFKEPNFTQSNNNINTNIGYNLFNNSTRQQLKDLTN